MGLNAPKYRGKWITPLTWKGTTSSSDYSSGEEQSPRLQDTHSQLLNALAEVSLTSYRKCHPNSLSLPAVGEEK